jgi:hypothetical protein
MVQLISQNQLGGCHYWMGLPGLDAHPCPDILPDPPHFTMVKEGQTYVPVPAPLTSFLPDAADIPPSPSIASASSSSSSSFSAHHLGPEDHRTSGKHPRNKCPHCHKCGHFGRECKTPHIFCANRGFCKLQKKTECPYPRAHGRQARLLRKRALTEPAPSDSSGYMAGIDEQEIAYDSGLVLFDMDCTN